MSTYKNAFGVRQDKKIEYNKEQKKLKEKHGIEDENVKVIETTNVGQDMLNKFIALIKIMATIILIFLAAIGILTIIYSEPRNELLIIIDTTWKQISQSVSYILQ